MLFLQEISPEKSPASPVKNHGNESSNLHLHRTIGATVSDGNPVRDLPMLAKSKDHFRPRPGVNFIVHNYNTSCI